MFLEPLLGLTSDQVDRFNLSGHNLEAYHCDEHKLEDMKLLVERLEAYNSDDEEANHVSINLFLGPRLLNMKAWQSLLEKLARRDLISSVVVDEAHFVEQSGRHFRPEFISATKFLGDLTRLMPTPSPITLLSATMTKKDIEKCVHLLGNKQPNILHGPLDRRTIKFTVIISGNAVCSLRKSARKSYKEDPEKQQIWYTHSRLKAETSLRDMADTLLEENRKNNDGPNSVAQSFVGTDGIMMKVSSIDAIKHYEDLDGEGTLLDQSLHSRIAQEICGNSSADEDQ